MKRTLTLSLALLALVSCSIEQRLARTSAESEDIFAAARDWEQLPLRTISWNQALSIIREKNNELRKLESSIRRNEREELSVYTDMIPGVSYYGYMTKSINDVVSAYSSDDVNSTIKKRLNIDSNGDISFNVSWGGEPEALRKLINAAPIMNTNERLMPLKDGIDFAEFMVDVTIKYQRFSDCIKTCGGDIDVLVMTKDKAFWYRNKLYKQ